MGSISTRQCLVLVADKLDDMFERSECDFCRPKGILAFAR